MYFRRAHRIALFCSTNLDEQPDPAILPKHLFVDLTYNISVISVYVFVCIRICKAWPTDLLICQFRLYLKKSC